MRKWTKNPELITDDEIVEIEHEVNHEPTDYAPWYEQFKRLPEKKRAEISTRVMSQIKEARPDTYNFIKKFRCELVGICPKIEYCLCDAGEGELEVTWVHSFSMATLLYWCPEGKFGFFVNPIIDYNDTVLNKKEKNKRQSLRGFTS